MPDQPTDNYCFHGCDRTRDSCPVCDGSDYLDTHDIHDRPLPGTRDPA